MTPDSIKLSSLPKTLRVLAENHARIFRQENPTKPLIVPTLGGSFSWSDTSEGIDFWGDLDQEATYLWINDN